MEEEFLTPRERAFLAANPDAAKFEEPREPGAVGPSGVGGWLALLIAGLTVFGPLISVARLVADFSQAEAASPAIVDQDWWRGLKALGWLQIAIYSSASVYAGIKLANVFQPSSVRLAINTIWIAGPMLTIATLLLSTIFLPVPIPTEDFIITPIQPIVVATIWTLYLKRSRRVKNTYFAGVE